MPVVTIEGTSREASPGNLNEDLAGDKLLLPENVANAMRSQGVRTAEDLLSYMQSFPSGAAQALHWSLSDVGNATTKLKQALQGHVRQELLHPAVRSHPPLGARNPDELP